LRLAKAVLGYKGKVLKTGAIISAKN